MYEGFILRTHNHYMRFILICVSLHTCVVFKHWGSDDHCLHTQQMVVAHVH